MDNLNRKRIYIALLLLTVLFFTVILLGIRYIQKLDNPELTYRIFGTFSFVLLAAIVIFLVAIGILVLSLLQSKDYTAANKMIRRVIDFLFPITLFLGKLIGIEADKIKGSYVNVCNQVIKTKDFSLKPEEILILTPHCLQHAECPHKITIDVNNCKKCGLCPVGDLLSIKEDRGVELIIATGGTLARKFIKEKRPKAIIAVACERDLTSGMQDVKKIPVIGVLNQRPEGPCYNTLVDLEKVEEALEFFLERTCEIDDSQRDGATDSI